MVSVRVFLSGVYLPGQRGIGGGRGREIGGVIDGELRGERGHDDGHGGRCCRGGREAAGEEMEGAAGGAARFGPRPDLLQRWPQPHRRRVHAAGAERDQSGRHACLGCKPPNLYLPPSLSCSSRCQFVPPRMVVVMVECLSPWQGFGGEDDVVLCGVFDGHGPHGHLVARRVRDALPLKLMSAVRASKAGLDMPAAAWRKAFASAYKAMDKDLRSHAILDCFCSGSTAVTVLKLVRATGLDASLLSIDSCFAETYVKSILLGCMRSAVYSPLMRGFCTQGSDLYMANIGDSRAVLGSRDSGGGGGMVAVQLTVDLKPDVPSRPPYSPSTIISDLWMWCRVIRNLSVNATFCHFRRGRTD